MTKEQAIRECMDLVSAARRADGVYELTANMLQSVIEVAVLNGDMIGDAKGTDRTLGLADDSFGRMIADITKLAGKQ